MLRRAQAPTSSFLLYTQEAIAAHGREVDRDELLHIQRVWRDMDKQQNTSFEQTAQMAKLKYEKQIGEFNLHGRFAWFLRIFQLVHAVRHSAAVIVIIGRFISPPITELVRRLSRIYRVSTIARNANAESVGNR